jgi:AcrR family transcriptional regulator
VPEEEMRMTGLRSQQRVATQERILSTARKLFLSAAFDQVGVREIAAEAGVATGTVIAAFGSKGDLLNAIVVEDLRIQLPLMEAAAEQFETTAERINALCAACVAYQAGQIAIVRASMADAWTRSDEAENRVRAAVKPMLSFIVKELERGIRRGEVRFGINLKLSAQMIFETVVNSYRIPIYGDRSMQDLTPILGERLALLLSAICVLENQDQHTPIQSNSQSLVA